MPRYDIIDADGIIEEVSMTIAEYEQFMLDNPTKKQYFGTPIPTLDSVRLGIRKQSDGFKEVLAKIKERAPLSNLDTTN